MKLRKTSIAILLLAALLLSACGAGQGPAAETAESRPLARSSLGEGIYYQTLAGAVGERALTGATDNLFSAKFEGDRVAGSAGPVNGNYRIQATQTDGEAWHVKLECNYHTTPGRDYRVTYRFHSDVGGLVKFGDHQEFTVVAGNNAVTGLLAATDDVSYLDLQLGALQPFTIDFSAIEVEELADKAVYTDVMPKDFRFDSEGTAAEQHDEGYEQELLLSDTEAALQVSKVPADAEVWKSRLLIRTGTTSARSSRPAGPWILRSATTTVKRRRATAPVTVCIWTPALPSSLSRSSPCPGKASSPRSWCCSSPWARRPRTR